MNLFKRTVGVNGQSLAKTREKLPHTLDFVSRNKGRTPPGAERLLRYTMERGRRRGLAGGIQAGFWSWP